MINRLFAYGTLMPGRENHYLVSDISGQWLRASMPGSLYPEGIGKAAGFPVLVPNENASLIQGWVLESDELPLHWQRLDDFEGDGYSRIEANVLMEDGSWQKACVYVLAEKEGDALRGQ